VVPYTANTYLPEGAGEGTGLPGFKSTEENPRRLPKQPSPHPAQQVPGPKGPKAWGRVSGVSVTMASSAVPRYSWTATGLNQYGLHSVTCSF